MSKSGMKNMGKKVFVILFVVILLWLCMSITATARNRMDREERQRNYVAQKEILISEARKCLKDMGFKNSGVSITRREWGENSEEWTMSVHHGRITKLMEEEREEVERALEEVAKKVSPGANVRISLQ